MVLGVVGFGVCVLPILTLIGVVLWRGKRPRER